MVRADKIKSIAETKLQWVPLCNIKDNNIIFVWYREYYKITYTLFYDIILQNNDNYKVVGVIFNNNNNNDEDKNYNNHSGELHRSSSIGITLRPFFYLHSTIPLHLRVLFSAYAAVVKILHKLFGKNCVTCCSGHIYWSNAQQIGWGTGFDMSKCEDSCM